MVRALRFSHGRRFAGRNGKPSLRLGRRPQGGADPVIRAYDSRLLDCLRRPELRDGRWQLLDCRPAWDGNPTWDRFIAFLWDGGIEGRQLVIVNYGPTRGQCVLSLPFDWLKDRQFLLRDLMSPVRYDRNGNDLRTKGLY